MSEILANFLYKQGLGSK